MLVPPGSSGIPEGRLLVGVDRHLATFHDFHEQTVVVEQPHTCQRRRFRHKGVDISWLTVP